MTEEESDRIKTIQVKALDAAWRKIYESANAARLLEGKEEFDPDRHDMFREPCVRCEAAKLMRGIVNES